MNSSTDTPVSDREAIAVDYLNATAAACSRCQGAPVAPAYRQLVRFFRCALIDRTETLQPGFRYRVLDPLPVAGAGEPLPALCDARGRELLARAQTLDLPLRVLWSGGIDSTATLVAVLKAAADAGDVGRVSVFLSRHSVREYPAFFRRVIRPRLRYTKKSDIKQALTPDALIVTGEHGDQIFGSVLAGDYLRDGRWYRPADRRLFAPWPAVLPTALAKRLGKREATRALDFLRPQLERSPLPLDSLFDLLWWVNFSMKWQSVTLRLAALRPDRYSVLRQRLGHFFRSDDFQRWSLANHEYKIGADWPSYKMPLKRYIDDYFPDPAYLAGKTKQASLLNVGRAPVARVVGFGVSVEVVHGAGDSIADGDGE